MNKYIKLFEQYVHDNNFEYVLEDVANHIYDVLSDFTEDEVNPMKLYAFGSRLKGTHKKESDFDVLFLYKGSLKSSKLQNLLNENISKINFEYTIDIMPVNILQEKKFINKFHLEYNVDALPSYVFSDSLEIKTNDNDKDKQKRFNNILKNINDIKTYVDVISFFRDNSEMSESICSDFIIYINAFRQARMLPPIDVKNLIDKYKQLENQNSLYLFNEYCAKLVYSDYFDFESPIM